MHLLTGMYTYVGQCIDLDVVKLVSMQVNTQNFCRSASIGSCLGSEYVRGNLCLQMGAFNLHLLGLSGNNNG